MAVSRPGLEDFDHIGMHPGHPLYCFVFDSRCIQWGIGSVYDLVTTARDLRVKTMVVPDMTSGQLSGLLELFDRSVVDEARLDSPEYLCAHWNRQLFTWTFQYDGRAWRSAYPIFDQYTDVYCPPDAGR